MDSLVDDPSVEASIMTCGLLISAPLGVGPPGDQWQRARGGNARTHTNHLESRPW